MSSGRFIRVWKSFARSVTFWKSFAALATHQLRSARGGALSFNQPCCKSFTWRGRWPGKDLIKYRSTQKPAFLILGFCHFLKWYPFSHLFLHHEKVSETKHFEKLNLGHVCSYYGTLLGWNTSLPHILIKSNINIVYIQLSKKCKVKKILSYCS